MNSSNPASVCIGMPIFNGLPYLHEAIESLRSQTFSDFKLLILDDRSSDGSLEACQHYATIDPRITVQQNPERLGGWRNLARLAELNTSDLFMWAAQDDRWSSNCLETLVSSVRETGYPAFGLIQPVLPDGTAPVNHPANMRTYHYMSTRSLRLRLTRYAWDPEWLGKANAMYSLFPARVSRQLPAILSRATENRLDFDYDLVFQLLQETPFIQNTSAVLYKREHALSWSHAGVAEQRSQIVSVPQRAIHSIVTEYNFIRCYQPHSSSRMALAFTRLSRRLVTPFRILQRRLATTSYQNARCAHTSTQP